MTNIEGKVIVGERRLRLQQLQHHFSYPRGFKINVERQRHRRNAMVMEGGGGGGP